MKTTLITPRPARKRRAVPFEKSLATTYPKLAAEWLKRENGDLTPADVVAGSGKRVWWRCQKCGHEWQTAVYNRTVGNCNCPACAGRVATPKNCLATVNPKLAKEWLKEKNGKLTPQQVTPGSNKKAWWRCQKCGHEWPTIISSRALNNNGCPACANKTVTGENCLAMTHPKLAKEWLKEKNGKLTPRKVVAGSGKKVWWKCQKCGHEWRTAISNRKKGHGCPACVNQTTTPKNCLAATHPHLAREWHEQNPLTPQEVNAGSHEKAWWRCQKCGHEWPATISNRKNGRGCPACVNRAITPTNNLAYNYPELTKEWHERNLLMPSAVVPGSGKNVWWRCRKCGHEWPAKIYHRARGIGCPACAGRVATPTNNLANTNPRLIAEWHEQNPLTPREVTASSGKKVWWRCRKCGHEWQTAIFDRSRGRGCPACANRVVTAKNCLAATHPHLVREWNKRNLLTPQDVTAGSGKKVWWKCSDPYCGHEWRTAVLERTKGYSCPACAKKVVTPTNNLAYNYPELAKEYSQDNEKASSKIYCASWERVKWVCRVCRHRWQATVHRRTVEGYGCPECRKKKPPAKKTAKPNTLAAQYPLLVADYAPTNKLKADELPANNDPIIDWQCAVCGFKWQARLSSRLKLGCPRCFQKNNEPSC